MQSPQEIRITVGSAAVRPFIEAIDRILPNDWTRAEAQERKAHSSLQGRSFVYRCERRAGRPAAFVFLFAWQRAEGFTFQVGAHADETRAGPSRQPLSFEARPQLTVAQYNEVLMDFCDEVLSRLPANALLAYALAPGNGS